MSYKEPLGVLRRISRILLIATGTAVTLFLAAGALFSLEVLSREPLMAIPSTNHPSIERRECIDCHADIAEEWLQSYHHRSLTGPYWKDLRDLGYLKIFELTRKACINCHAPANVLDLVESVRASVSPDDSLGVECTPNLLREPRGVIPAARADDTQLGVDCTACHVGRRGIVGPGRHATAAHEVNPDPRFQDPVLTSEKLCGTCHSSTVRAWTGTTFVSRGVTCLDCHMPIITAASAADGSARKRRSHRFPADKDPSMMKEAVNASLVITPYRSARFRILNDRVGHHFPSGGNWLSVRIGAYDGGGHMLREIVEIFGKEEPLLLDFLPFNTDRRIPSGESREVLLPLPEGSGRVVAVVRYHDWMRTGTTLATLTEEY